jgi:16S rRNA (cytosine967-C5)-methyltransferase
MSIAPARLVAFQVLLRVETQHAYASELLHSEQTSKLSPQDRNLATQIVMGALRWQSRVDAELQPFLSGKNEIGKMDAEVRTTLRMAVFQLRLLERVPASAIVNDAVALVKKSGKTSAAPLVNAVLRKVKPGTFASEQAGESARDISAELAHPLWLVERWTKQFSAERTRAICEAGQQQPRTSLRFPVGPREAESLEQELAEAGIALAAGGLVRTARRVTSGDVTATLAYREGRVGIQDEASQLVALLVGKSERGVERILDCCAAPGGKTQLMAERNPQARIVAAELYEQRARMMRDRLKTKNVEVVRADVTALNAGEFDRVLADVPCSGTGTLARNPEIKWRLRAEDLTDLHQRQVKILDAALDRAKPDARVVYSTCSLEKEEDEDVVAEIMRERKDARLVPIAQVLKELKDEMAWKDLESLVSGDFLRTLPGIHPCDGFFAAVLQKISA